jgi:hypothetical protein
MQGLNKAIALIKKTGDRIIVFDPETGNDGYVLMSVEEYERLSLKTSDVRNLTEGELLNKINRDISIWKTEQEIKDDSIEDLFVDSLTEEEAENIEDFRGEPDSNDQKKRWQIPRERKAGAEEAVEEENQYIEPIMF